MSISQPTALCAHPVIDRSLQTAGHIDARNHWHLTTGALLRITHDDVLFKIQQMSTGGFCLTLDPSDITDVLLRSRFIDFLIAHLHTMTLPN